MASPLCAVSKTVTIFESRMLHSTRYPSQRLAVDHNCRDTVDLFPSSQTDQMLGVAFDVSASTNCLSYPNQVHMVPVEAEAYAIGIHTLVRDQTKRAKFTCSLAPADLE
jgi:hypothetical protein